MNEIASYAKPETYEYSKENPNHQWVEGQFQGLLLLEEMDLEIPPIEALTTKLLSHEL